MISVIIPALNEVKTIGSVVAFARRDPAVNEVIVVDDGSIDGTPELARLAGARVITSTLLGKGASMEDGLWEARNEVLLYLDGDLSGLQGGLVQRMTLPILRDGADFVKARFSRSAGRVTALTAKPLLQLLFPELAHIEQPLGGVIAARRSLLGRLHFEDDYGVDVGLLLDVAMTGAKLVEADIGRLEHDGASLERLQGMATQVARTILDRASRHGRLNPTQINQILDLQLRGNPLAFLDELARVDRFALFDMDGVLLHGRFVEELAHRANLTGELTALLDSPSLETEERTRQIAALFVGVPRETFERVAQEMPLMAGAVETVVELRRAGYRVGIVSDSYHLAAEMVRRRVFADFSVAHHITFQEGRATGRILLSPRLVHPEGCQHHVHCKVNLLHHLLHRTGLEAASVLAVGDGENDVCLLRAAGLSVAFQPRTARVRDSARYVVSDNLTRILDLVGVSRSSSRSQAAIRGVG